MPGNAPPVKNIPKLKNEIIWQKQPKQQWKVVKALGTMDGAGNEGIYIVQAANDPYDRQFVEKRVKANEIKYGTAQKEVALLRQLGDHPNILKMVDYFIDEVKTKASVYLECCDAGDLGKVIAGSKNNPVHERKVWSWFMGLIDALLYCHRGPNPESDKNVMLYWNVIFHR